MMHSQNTHDNFRNVVLPIHLAAITRSTTWPNSKPNTVRPAYMDAIQAAVAGTPSLNT